jgi:hypothetical protein
MGVNIRHVAREDTGARAVWEYTRVYAVLCSPVNFLEAYVPTSRKWERLKGRIWEEGGIKGVYPPLFLAIHH